MPSYEELQEHTTEEQKNIPDDLQPETSKSEEDNKTNISPIEEESLQFVVEEHLVANNEASLTDDDQAEEKKTDSLNNANNIDSEEYKAQLEQENDKLPEESYEEEYYYNYQATNVLSATLYPNTNDLEWTMDHESQLDTTSESPEKELELLSEIRSIINPSQLDQIVTVISEGPDDGLDIQNVQNVTESGMELESELHAPPISAPNLDDHVELTEIADSEIVDGLDSIEKENVTLDIQPGDYDEDQSQEKITDLHSGSNDNGLTSDLHFNTCKDPLLEIQSLVTAPSELSEAIIKVEVDVKEELESHITLGHSVETPMVEEQVDNERDGTLTEELGSAHEPNQVNQQDFLSQATVTTSVLE
ncbi:uncharacterized protein [Pyxicephalus adspersus]|uniref:uncharacterized protein isoform X1 n=1 Tax=Pyxicephalus adspersus TaxID=30357 RepID=UPI003B5B2E58